MKRGLKSLGKIIGVGALLTTIASPIIINNYPIIQGTKSDLIPVLSLQGEYSLPNTETLKNIEPLVKGQLVDERNTLEERIASLIIGVESGIGDYIPGGVLLTTNQTRDGHLFGEFSSYDSERTQESVEKILEQAKEHRQRILIYDEGEGGYVMRVGTLPTAKDIGDFYFHNTISGTIKGKVVNSNKIKNRKKQIQELFRGYALELKDRGIDVVFGPVLDVINENYKGVVKNSGRSYSTQFDETQKLAELYIQAMHSQEIRVIGKHFLTTTLTDEDPHENEAVNDSTLRPRLNAGELFKKFKEDLDGVMVTHTGNPSDLNRPYSLSRRGFQFLTQNTYPNNDETSAFIDERSDRRQFRGIAYDGFVIIDDVQMGAIREYVRNHQLSERGKKLVEGSETIEARSVVLAIDQGAHGAIVRGDIDSVVRAISYAYKQDQTFANKIDKALAEYEEFKR